MPAKPIGIGEAVNLRKPLEVAVVFRDRESQILRKVIRSDRADMSKPLQRFNRVGGNPQFHRRESTGGEQKND